MRCLRCRSCGYLDASVPTAHQGGDECDRCGSDNTRAVIIRTL